MIIQNSIAPLVSTDHNKVIQIFRNMPRQHSHLDWHSLAEWLEKPELRCWTASHQGSLEAVLGATLCESGNGPRAAWLRFAIPPAWGARNGVFAELWQALAAELRGEGVEVIGLLDIDEWMGRYARRWGFDQTNAVVTLRRASQVVPEPLPIDASLRGWSLRDLDATVRVDTTAFEPLWRYNQQDIAAAAQQAVTFIVVEVEREIVAYQLSTRYAGSGHLARLAVLPEYQGRKYGGALVNQMLRFFLARNIDTVTVNTQADNTQSQRLYRRFGFELTGHRVPVWTLEL